jgi:peroxiredoxin
MKEAYRNSPTPVRSGVEVFMRNRFSCLLAVVIFAGSRLATASTPPAGSAAPAFALPAANGSGVVRLADEVARHSVTVVMFISTRCPISNGYNDRMERLEKDYAARGVRFLGVNSNVNEPATEVVSHSRSHGFSFAVLKDDGSKVADMYGASHTPEIFVVDRSGVLRYHGRIDENAQDAAGVKSPDLRNALEALLAGRPVPAAETKAFGCSIKRP